MSDDPSTHSRPFESTNWSRIREVCALDPVRRREALDEFVRRYQRPLRAHLMVARRLDRATSDDILQAFLTKKLLDQQILDGADPARGKLRSLLVRALDHFFYDWHRRRTSARGGHAPDQSIDQGHPATLAVAPSDGPGVADVEWAKQVLSLALKNYREECRSSGRSDLWDVLECRVLRPALEGTPALAYPDLVARFKLRSPEQASNILMTAKRGLRRAIEQVIAEYADGDDIGPEMHELWRVLNSAGALGVEVPGDLSDPQAPDADEWASIHASHSAHLDQLFQVSEDPDQAWSNDDLSALLAHQLRLPLATAFPELVERAAAKPLPKNINLQQLSLAHLLDDAGESAEILRAIKEVCRKRVRRENDLPAQVAVAIYFGVIAVALVRNGERITNSDDQVLQFGFARVMSFGWLDLRLQNHVAQATGLLATV